VIKVACVKFGGLATGGTEKLLQSIAAYLPKDQFDVTFFYCDSAPYIGSNWVHPDTDPERLKFLQDHNVKLKKFHVGAKDVTHPHHMWIDSNFFEIFNEDDYDIIQTARAGHTEYPFTLINRTPIVDAITLPGMAEDKINIKSVFHISKYQAMTWVNAGGPIRKAVILPIFQNLNKSSKSLREELEIPEDDFVFGFHQRVDDGIATSIALQAYKRIQNDKTHFVVMGGSKNYTEFAKSINLLNFKQIPHSGNEEDISQFLNTLDVFCHNRADGETFGAVISEALFHGLPVISHYAPALGQIETVGPAGFICSNELEYADAMTRLMIDDDLYQRLSVLAVNHYNKNYTTESCMKTVVSTYKRVYRKFLTKKRSSYDAHNSEYIEEGKFEKELAMHLENTKNRVQYNPDMTLGLMLDNSEVKIGVDIGSGTGWCASLMSNKLDHVYAIEPSKAAIEIANKIYPRVENITWINRFACEGLDQIELNEPAIFNASCVLSHLEDADVEAICAKINKMSKPGSYLSFSECHGNYFNDIENLWHVRPEAWWQSKFPSWRFYFNSHTINHPQGAKKGFWAVKAA
jgi:glycosyltransferase involved in cell wall biosynthesis